MLALIFYLYYNYIVRRKNDMKTTWKTKTEISNNRESLALDSTVKERREIFKRNAYFNTGKQLSNNKLNESSIDSIVSLTPRSAAKLASIINDLSLDTLIELRKLDNNNLLQKKELEEEYNSYNKLLKVIKLQVPNPSKYDVNFNDYIQIGLKDGSKAQLPSDWYLLNPEDAYISNNVFVYEVDDRAKVYKNAPHVVVFSDKDELTKEDKINNYEDIVNIFPEYKKITKPGDEVETKIAYRKDGTPYIENVSEIMSKSIVGAFKIMDESYEGKHPYNAMIFRK